MRDHMDPVLGQELERVFADLDSTRRSVGGPGRGTGGPDLRRRTALVTAVVGIIVVIAATLAIQSVRPAADPAVVPSPTSSGVSRSALLRALPTQPYGRVLHTWTEHDATDPTGPFTATGSTIVLAAVCTGGGTISITAPDRPAHKLGCSKLTVQQPFWKFNLGGDGKSTKETAPFRVTVSVLSGAPRYIVRLWAVDPRILEANSWSVAATSADVPKSLRTCTAADIAPTGTVGRTRDGQGGVVTISSRSTTDCAVRAWPTMRYLNATGGQVGPTQGENENGKSLDSSEGSLNRYGEFPPARLTAKGHAYLIIDLATEARLTQDDADRKASQAKQTPSPGPSFPVTFCRPERIAAVRLGIGNATVTVPAPSIPPAAACKDDTVAFGVNPVVAERPNAD